MSEFELGQVLMTRGIAESDLDKVEIAEAVERHSRGDWGSLSIGDKQMNDLAVISGEDRIFSAYVIDGEKIYIITEWDRSVTTILFPSEY